MRNDRITEGSHQRRRRNGTRTLLLLPPLLVLTLACLLILSAPLSWGAGRSQAGTSWLLPAIALLVGLGAFPVGRFALKNTRHVTRGYFQVLPIPLIFGTLMLFGGAAMLLNLTLQLSNGSAYRNAFDEDGALAINATGFLIVSLLMGAFHIGWLWAGAFLYNHALSNDPPNRIEPRRAGEADGISRLLRERD